MGLSSKISPVLFFLCIVSFFFTFVTVSCQGHEMARFTGIQMATGATVDEPPQGFGPQGFGGQRKISPDPFAALALLCAVLGAGISLLGGRAAIAAAASGAVGTLSLLIMKSRVDSEVMKRGEGVFQVSYGAGFALALLLMIAGVAWNGFLLSQNKNSQN